MRYNWRHDSVLLKVYNSIKSQQGLKVFDGIEDYPANQ